MKRTLEGQFKQSLIEAVEDALKQAKSEKEKEEIIDRLNSLDLQKTFSELLDDVAADSVEDLKLSMFMHVMRFRANEQEFVARQEQKWYRAFAASEAMYILTLETAESYSKYVDSIPEDEAESKRWQYVSLRHIHGRALQIYLEIITLMRNGFADGAEARWRSLYELAIVSWFISKYGEDVAKAYYQAANSDDRYEWARSSKLWDERKKIIRFDDIRKNCTIDTSLWNEQYTLSNRILHPSPQGTFGRLANMGTESLIPVGRSDYGIETPGVNSVISLAQISVPFFSVYNHEETIISMKSIQQWIDVVKEEYFKTHDTLFPDDEPLYEEPDKKEEMCVSGTSKNPIRP